MSHPKHHLTITEADDFPAYTLFADDGSGHIVTVRAVGLQNILDLLTNGYDGLDYSIEFGLPGYLIVLKDVYESDKRDQRFARYRQYWGYIDLDVLTYHEIDHFDPRKLKHGERAKLYEGTPHHRFYEWIYGKGRIEIQHR